MKKRLLSLVLCLVMVFSLFPAFGMNASALDTNGITNPSTAQDKTGKLNLSKELSQNTDGTYDITLKSWATNTVETEIIPEQVPTDFVLVLDQSGSMATVDMPTGFTKVNQTNFSTQNIVDADSIDDPYYFLAPDGKYYPVHERDAGTYSKLSNIYIYKQNGVPITGWGAKDGLTKMELPFVARTNVTGESDGTTEAYYLYKGVYYRLSVYAVGLPLRFQGTPFFTDANGTRHNLKTYTYTWGVGDLVINPKITDTIYKKTSTAYKLYYLDDNGNAVDIGNQVGNRSTTAYSGDLYKKNADESRLSALQKSVNTFIDTIAGQKNADGSRVDHRVAIVGFASGNQKSGRTNVGNTYYYEVNEYGSYDANIGLNTELFDGATQKNYFSGNLQNADYLAALKSTDQTGVQQLKASVNALEANGATFPNYGLEMAEHVFTSRGEEGAKYTKLDGITKDNRNMVVVMFTDGVPGLNEYDNQFRAANNVVAEAKNLKDMDAEVYTVGVFSQDDTHPLQYSLKKYDTNTNSYSQTAAEQPNFLYSELETYTNGNYAFTYYMFRGNNTMELNGTDTVGNYMRVTSSDYEDATSFMDSNTPNPSTGLTGRGTATSDTHYMRASDTKALENVFKTIATNVNHSGTPIAIDHQAVLKDVVDLEHFAFTNASDVVAYTVLGTTTDNENYDFGTDVKEELDPTWDQTTGSITVDGFNYSTKYISSMSGENGRQLIVKITNLIPTDSGDALTSNDGDAKITVEKDGKIVDVVSIGSPAIRVSNKTYIMDFNAKMKLAEGATRMVNADDNGVLAGTNGNYVKAANGDVTYQLNSGKQLGTTKNDAGKIEYSATINGAYTAVDSAMVYGKAYDLQTEAFAANPAWNQITTVPASSVYYDDDFTKEDAPVINVGDGSGYNAAFNESANYTENKTDPNTEQGQYTFTFYGSGIDVYCTTDTTSKYIQGKIDGGDGQLFQTIKNRVDDADHVRYNVPTLSFRFDAPGEHTLTLYILSTSKCKLDGIRVYNPVSEQVYTENNVTSEQNAYYKSLRDLLVNDQKTYMAADENNGVLFVDNTAQMTKTKDKKDADGNVVMGDDGKPVQISIYDTGDETANVEFEAYKANSPKHEIYLSQNQGIVFTLHGVQQLADTAKFMVGLSVADNDKTAVVSGIEGTVDDVKDKNTVSSPLDMYYTLVSTVTANEDSTKSATFTIVNEGSAVVAVTNLKIVGNNAPVTISSEDMAVTLSVEDDLDTNVAEAVEPVELDLVLNQRTLFTAAKVLLGETDEPETPAPTTEPEVTPEPTPAPEETPAPEVTPEPTQAPSVHDIVKQIVSSFVSNLFRSISRLFGN